MYNFEATQNYQRSLFQTKNGYSYYCHFLSLSHFLFFTHTHTLSQTHSPIPWLTHLLSHTLTHLFWHTHEMQNCTNNLCTFQFSSCPKQQRGRHRGQNLSIKRIFPRKNLKCQKMIPIIQDDWLKSFRSWKVSVGMRQKLRPTFIAAQRRES